MRFKKVYFVNFSIISVILIWFLCSGISLWAQDTKGRRSVYQVYEQYRIGPEDILEISVWKEQDMTKQVVVTPNGNITFPLLGELQVAGLTVQEIEEEIKKVIRKYIPDAIVSVMIVQVNSFKVSVLGKVTRPGVYPVGRAINVLQALSYAGGLTPFAKASKIIIVRNGGEDENIKYSFDYNRVKKGKSLEQNILLENGDVIIVP